MNTTLYLTFFSKFLFFFVCFFSLSPLRVAHPLADRRASGVVFREDARHLAPSPWLLAVGWHRNVSFPKWGSKKLSIWKSERSYCCWVCEQRYETRLSANLSPLVFLFVCLKSLVLLRSFFVSPWLERPSQTWLRSLAGHSERPTLCRSQWALQDWDAQGQLPGDEEQVLSSPL